MDRTGWISMGVVVLLLLVIVCWPHPDRDWTAEDDDYKDELLGG